MKKQKREHSNLSQKEQFRNQSLAYKISVATALLLVICLSIMIIISATLAARSLSKTVTSEFEGIATENSLTVQNVIDTADNAATLLQNYMEEQYDEFAKNGYNEQTEKSDVYNVELPDRPGGQQAHFPSGT